MKKKRLTFLDNFGFPDKINFYLERMNWIYEKKPREKPKKTFFQECRILEVKLGYRLRVRTVGLTIRITI